MLKKIQAASGALFAVFVVIHLFNTWLAALGPGAYDGFQALVQIGYQALLLEAALLAALVIHIIAGLLRLREPRGPLSPRQRWHRVSGFFLVAVIFGHIMAVRGASWFYDVWPGFGGVAFTLDFAPLFFYPYYFALGVAGFYHGLNGLSIALPRLGLKLPIGQRAIVRSTAAASVLTLLALLGLSGVWTDIGDPYTTEFARLALGFVDAIAP